MLPLQVVRKKEAIEPYVGKQRIRRNNKLAKKYLSEAKTINNKEPLYVA
jgi:hypothetical protein